MFFIWLECCWMAFSLFDWIVVGWPFLYLTGMLLDGLFFIWLECCWMAFSLFDWNVGGWPFLYLTGMLLDGLFKKPKMSTTSKY
jgi:hypothetical protein